MVSSLRFLSNLFYFPKYRILGKDNAKNLVVGMRAPRLYPRSQTVIYGNVINWKLDIQGKEFLFVCVYLCVSITK